MASCNIIKYYLRVVIEAGNFMLGFKSVYIFFLTKRKTNTSNDSMLLLSKLIINNERWTRTRIRTLRFSSLARSFPLVYKFFLVLVTSY